MYASRTTQFIVGVFGLLGILAIAILSFRLGDLSLFPPPSYVLFANFDNISGLKNGNDVEIAGVKVGKVTRCWLHDSQARVALRINDGVDIDSDAIAGIKTAGLLGDKFVSIELGGGEKTLHNGDTIRQTQSSFILEDVIGNLINNAGSGGSNNGGGKEQPKDEIGAPPGAAPSASAPAKAKSK